MARDDPFRNFKFRVEIDGVAEAAFSEVAIGETTTEAIEYREGNEPNHVRKLPGLTKYGNITLKRGVTDSQVIYQWHKDIVDGKIGDKRKSIAIVVHRRGRQGQGALRRRRMLADQIRSQRSQRQGQRSLHRAPRARQ